MTALFFQDMMLRSMDSFDILELYSTAISLSTHTTIPSRAMSLSAPCAAARYCRLATRSPITPSAHCVRLTSLPSFQRRRKPSRRWQSTDAAGTNPKISGIVDQISQLTLLETADLVASLKVRRQSFPQGSHVNPSASALLPSHLH